MELQPELISVKLRMLYVEKFKKQESFISLSEGDKGELLTQIAPFVRLEDTDEFAKRFDNFMFGLMLAHVENIPAFQYAKKQLCELERVLTDELGSREDYKREFGDTPFGLLIRKIAKLDHEAAMQAFSDFINDQSLNQKQITFVNKIINHIELNGYMENVAELTKPPFDKPISFVKLFDAKTRTALMETINQVRENAVQISYVIKFFYIPL